VTNFTFRFPLPPGEESPVLTVGHRNVLDLPSHFKLVVGRYLVRIWVGLLTILTEDFDGVSQHVQVNFVLVSCIALNLLHMATE
jgi:hypothetical protein